MLVLQEISVYLCVGRFSVWAIAAASGSMGRLSMIPNLLSGGREVALFEAFSHGAKPDPWSALRWGVLVPVALVGNVALAIVAWYGVELAMKLF